MTDENKKTVSEVLLEEMKKQTKLLQSIKSSVQAIALIIIIPTIFAVILYILTSAAK